MIIKEKWKQNVKLQRPGSISHLRAVRFKLNIISKMIFKFLFLICFASSKIEAKFPDWLVTSIDWPAQVLKESGNLVKTIMWSVGAQKS
jgi:hypothetical protein